jgi:hypothetical protein
MSVLLDFVKNLDPFVGALGFLSIIWAIVAVAHRSAKIWRVAVGVDGKFSTSKLQQFIWTGAVVFSYAAVFLARAHLARLEPIHEIPPNVLLALGFTVGTSILAAGITTDHVESGKEIKTSAGTIGQGAASLVEDDAGRLDLAKVQLLAWTLIAIFAYVLSTIDVVGRTLATAVDSQLPGLPDIDPTLMVLTGLGQGAYIGKKLVTKTTSGITSLSVPKAAPGEAVIATGVGFGEPSSANVLTMRDVPITPKSWTPTAISFVVPASPPWGGVWTQQKVRINVVVDGQIGANAAFLEVVPAAP